MKDDKNMVSKLTVRATKETDEDGDYVGADEVVVAKDETVGGPTVPAEGFGHAVGGNSK